jgi:hypothetical protein
MPGGACLLTSELLLPLDGVAIDKSMSSFPVIPSPAHCQDPASEASNSSNECLRCRSKPAWRKEANLQVTLAPSSVPDLGPITLLQMSGKREKKQRKFVCSCRTRLSGKAQACWAWWDKTPTKMSGGQCQNR